MTPSVASGGEAGLAPQPALVPQAETIRRNKTLGELARAFWANFGQDQEQRRCARLFWGWLALRTALWTALATLSQPNAPLDLIEWLTWGHEWRWGYHKHPPFPAWIAEAFSLFSPGSLWTVYLASYLTTALCFWAVWRLGRELLPPRLALLAALSLEGILFFNY